MPECQTLAVAWQICQLMFFRLSKPGHLVCRLLRADIHLRLCSPFETGFWSQWQKS